MLRIISSTLSGCALAASVTVFAQTPAPTPAPAQTPTPAPAPATAAAQPEATQVPKETLTGCVMEAKTTDGSTAYVLNNAEGGTAKMYVLRGASQSDVAANVNKKVEVIGPVQQPSAPAEGAPAPDPKVLRPPLMDVESVKMVAETCK